MNNNIKELIEQLIENDIDEPTIIKNNVTDSVGVYKDLLDTLLNTFNELGKLPLISNIKTIGFNNVLHKSIVSNTSRNIGWQTGLIIEDAIISIISKNFKKINKTKVIPGKRGEPIKDCVFEVNPNEKYNVQIKCVKLNNYKSGNIMNNAIRKENNIGIVLIYHLQQNNKYKNGVDLYIDKIYVFLCKDIFNNTESQVQDDKNIKKNKLQINDDESLFIIDCTQ